MSNDTSDGDASHARPTTVIPQDTSTGVFKFKLGFTFAELALIGAPIAAEIWVILTYFDPAEWQLWLILGTAIGMGWLVTSADDHLTPRELVARSVGTTWAQISMPFGGERARNVPGVVDVHPDADAVERRDGAQVALVEVAPTNLSQADAKATDEHALATARAIDTKLSKKGTPAKVLIRRRPPTSISDQVADLEDAAAADRPRGELAFAAERADHASDEVVDQGAMDQTILVATWVTPDEVAGAGTSRLDGWAHTRFVRPSESLRDTQHDRLETRVANVRDACSPQEGATTPLSTDGIVTALRDYWVDSDADSESRWSSMRGSLKTAFAPDHVDAHRRHVDVAEHHTSTFWVAGWPKRPIPGFLAPITEAEDVEADIALFVGRADRDRKMDELADRADKVSGAGVDSDDDAGREDAAAYETDIAHLRDHIRDDGVDPTEVSMYVTLRAPDTDTLSEARSDFRDDATDADLTVALATGATRQLDGLVSTSPTGGDRLFEAMRGWLDKAVDHGGLIKKAVGTRTGTRTRWDMPPGAIGAMLPFSGGVRRDHGGVLYGLAKSVDDNAVGMLQVARDRLTAPHRFFVGRSGSGKTFRETVNLGEELIRNHERKAVILDIARNFDGIVELFDGEKVVLGETTVNPFSVDEGGDLDGTIRMLTNMFHIYLRHNTEPGTAEAVRADLSTAIRETFRSVGIHGPEDAGKPSPTMHDFHDVLEKMHDNQEEYTVRGTDTETEELREHAGLLLSRLKPFTETGEYSYLVADPDDPDGAADLDARVVLFDMSNYQESEGAEKGMLTMFVLSQAFTVAAGATDRLVNVVVDEAHDVFRDADQAGRFESTVRAGRNAGLCFDFLSQAGDDFDAETAGAIAGQCEVSVWGALREQEADVPLEFGWSNGQAASIVDLETGDKESSDHSEAMVNIDGDRYLTEFRVGPVVKAVAEYREADDGPWEPYLQEAIEAGAEAEAERAADEVAEVAP